MAQEKRNPQPGAEVKTDGLKIIGAGFGRTGTRSLKEALEILGFGRCYHMVEVFEHPEHLAHWEAASRNEPIDWTAIFHDYQATVDWPGCTFYKPLLAAYPNAKVLLSVRDPEHWYESVKSTIYQVSRSDRTSPGLSSPLALNPMQPDMASIGLLIDQLIWNGTFHNRFEDKEDAIAIFHQHNEEVKTYVPPEKLLVYQVKESWEPLCAFLGVPVPDVPFPHLNDRESFLMRRDV